MWWHDLPKSTLSPGYVEHDDMAGHKPEGVGHREDKGDAEDTGEAPAEGVDEGASDEASEDHTNRCYAHWKKTLKEAYWGRLGKNKLHELRRV